MFNSLNLRSMSERPDTVEDYFGLVGDFLLHCPHLLTQSQLVDPGACHCAMRSSVRILMWPPGRVCVFHSQDA